MTTDTGRLLELAERCERATGRDDLLARDIARATNKVINAAPVGADGCGVEHFPDFTASLDAAMTLVPEGWDTQLRTHATTDGTALAVLTDKEWLDEEPTGRLVQADAATPALALCAASLRARTASATGEGL